jgi:hypothetical protein
MAEKTNPLTCKQCGYANEGERVYCHNCGTKLDRSLLPELSAPEESLAQKQKRIKKIVSPSRGFFAGALKAFIYTMLSSLATAVVILVLLPPDEIPEAKSKSDLLGMDIPSISMNLRDATESPTPVKITLTQADINPYLQYTIKAAETGALGDQIKFSRVFVNLDESMIRITAVQTVFGHPIYSTVFYKLAIVNNKLVATTKGGHFGRLQIHPNLMKNLESVFQKLWDSDEFKRDKNYLDQCQSVEVHKDHVDIITQPRLAQ